VLGTSAPSGDNIPIPVTTTRLRDTALSFILLTTLCITPKEKTARQSGSAVFP
jgi:hypothetical protein